MKCLDTTFLIDLMHNEASAVRKARELEEVGFNATTEINVFELVYGIHRSKLGDRKARLAQAEQLFSRLVTFPLNHEAALNAGKILGKLSREGKEASPRDGMIASVAITHGCNVIVTRNTKHFVSIPGIQVEVY